MGRVGRDIDIWDLPESLDFADLDLKNLGVSISRDFVPEPQRTIGLFR